MRRSNARQLLLTGERETIKGRCRYAHFDAHGFQALAFYVKRGYTIVDGLKDMPPWDTRYSPRKDLRLE